MTAASRSGRTRTQARARERAMGIRLFALALADMLGHSYKEGVADGFEVAMLTAEVEKP